MKEFYMKIMPYIFIFFIACNSGFLSAMEQLRYASRDDNRRFLADLRAEHDAILKEAFGRDDIQPLRAPIIPLIPAEAREQLPVHEVLRAGQVQEAESKRSHAAAVAVQAGSAGDPDAKKQCTVCYEELNNSDFVRLACGHREVCVDCLAKIRNQQCPLCRADFSYMRETIRNRYLEKYPDRTPEGMREQRRLRNLQRQRDFERSRERRQKLGGIAAVGVAAGGLYLTYKLYNKIYKYHPDDHDTSTVSRKIMHSTLAILKHMCSSVVVWIWPAYRLRSEMEHKIKNIWSESKSPMPSESELWKKFNDQNAAMTGCLASLAVVAACAFGTYVAISHTSAPPAPADDDGIPAIFN